MSHRSVLARLAPGGTGLRVAAHAPAALRTGYSWPWMGCGW